MNIKVCKKCPNFPEYFTFSGAYYEKFQLLFGRIGKMRSSGCSFWINKEDYDYFVKNGFVEERKIDKNRKIRCFNRDRILEYIEQDCPFKFEQEVLR